MKMQSAGPTVLSANNLWKSHGDHVVLRDRSIELISGELACLVGPNGAGKSTLMRILSLQERPDRGSLYVLGKDASLFNDRLMDQTRADTIHYIPQHHFGLLDRPAIENITIWLRRLDGLSANEAKQQATRALDLVGLPQRKHNEPIGIGFSGGEQARVAIASAFARRRPICLVDEVFAGVDETWIPELVKLFRQLATEGAAVLVVVHRRDIWQLFDRVISL